MEGGGDNYPYDFSVQLSNKYRLKYLHLNLMVKQSTRWRQTPVRSVADVFQSDSRVGGLCIYGLRRMQGCTQSHTTRLWLERVKERVCVCCLVFQKACIHLCQLPYNVCPMKSPIESEGGGGVTCLFMKVCCSGALAP